MNHLQNLTVLRDAILNEPTEKIDLGAFESFCGTIHCAAGLAFTMPFFQALGLKQDFIGAPYLPSAPLRSGRYSADRALNTLFKPFPDVDITDCEVAYDYLFEARMRGTWDDELMVNDLMTDKELIIARLNKSIYLWTLSAANPQLHA